MKPESPIEAEVGRRDLLRSMGRGALGAGLVTLGASLPVGRAEAAVSGKWPWPYAKLDPQKTGDLAYEEWYRVFCGAAVINAVFRQLAEKVGEPYRSFPSDAFMFLEGGVSGWGTICGANAGANIVANCIIGPRLSGTEDGMLMGSELLQHYASTAMPTFTPAAPKLAAAPVKTVAGSPLCHVSVGRWMKAAQKELGSPERRDRCARVTASMAFQLVTLLNAWKDGTYKTRGAVPAKSYGIQAQHDCDDCHGSNVPSPPSPRPAK